MNTTSRETLTWTPNHHHTIASTSRDMHHPQKHILSDSKIIFGWEVNIKTSVHRLGPACLSQAPLPQVFIKSTLFPTLYWSCIHPCSSAFTPSHMIRIQVFSNGNLPFSLSTFNQSSFQATSYMWIYNSVAFEARET